jgi:hypothetical protein
MGERNARKGKPKMTFTNKDYGTLVKKYCPPPASGAPPHSSLIKRTDIGDNAGLEFECLDKSILAENQETSSS